MSNQANYYALYTQIVGRYPRQTELGSRLKKILKDGPIQLRISKDSEPVTIKDLDSFQRWMAGLDMVDMVRILKRMESVA